MRARAVAKLGPVLAFFVAGSFASGPAALRADDLQPHLWRDFAPGENSQANSDPRNLVQLPEGTWFSARTREFGLEAWVIPTGSEVPQLLADLCPGECDAYPYGFAFTDSFLLFSSGYPFANPGGPQAPAAVWVTAGSSSSTVRLFDLPEGSYAQEFWQLYPGEAPSQPLDNGVVLFLMTLGPGRTEVWRSDGTVAGTFSLASFAAGDSSGMSLRGTGNDRLLIVGDLPGGMTEVWHTDGTRSGTRRVESFSLDLRRVSPGMPVFLLGNTPGETFHYELWSVDAAGHSERIFQNDDDLHLTDLGAFQVGSRAIFSVVEEGVGTQLWLTDGTTGGTVLRSTDDIPLLDPRVSATVGDDLFYIDSLGGSLVVRQLRLSGSGPPETVEVACSGECASSNLYFVRALGTALVYPIQDEALGRELATRDALTGERTVFDLCPGVCGSDSGPVRDLDGLFLFSASSEEHGLQLYSFMPPSRVVRLTDLPLANGLIYDPGNIPLLQLPDRLYFAASVGYSGVELCSAALDGSHSAVVADLAHEPWSSQPIVSAVFPDGMFINTIRPGDASTALYWSDGTPEGTRPLLPDDGSGGCPGYASAYLALSPLGERSVYWTRSHVFSDAFDLCLADPHSIRRIASGLTGSYLAEENELFWTADDEVWVFDESTSEARALFALPNELASAQLAFADERWLYFLSTTESLSALWRISRAGAGLSQLAALPTESTSAFERRAQLGARTLFFLTTPDSVALWATDGTRGGTGSIASWPLAAGYLDAVAIEAYRDRLYFLLDSGAAGESEVWRTDGTPAGTQIAARLPAGRFAYPRSARVTPLGLYFIAFRGEEPAELWRSDGTQAGTFALYPPANGVTGQGAIDFAFFRDRILFSATGEEAGAELWQTFGTPASTALAADLRPGIFGSGPAGFAVLGDRLFFSADDGTTGSELWMSPAPTAFPCPIASDLACTGDGRFRWYAGWRDFADRQGVGQASAALPGAAAFWFFAPENLELVGKLVDGRAVNGFTWTYLAALSNLETSLTLFDVATGAHADYASPLGRFTSLGDVRALPAAEEAAHEPANTSPLRPARWTPSDAAGDCAPSSTRLCLADGRFAVEIEWRDFAGRTGAGHARELTGNAGSFWFFSEGNPELVVKVLDGAESNGHFWVFAGGLGNLELNLTVLDTATHERRSYSTRLGQFMSFGDLTSFPE